MLTMNGQTATKEGRDGLSQLSEGEGTLLVARGGRRAGLDASLDPVPADKARTGQTERACRERASEV